MSNLLKKDPDSEVAVFGFPVIQEDNHAAIISTEDDNADADTDTEANTHADAEREQQPSVPEIDTEELYRRKLLEIERSTQEIERNAYSLGFAQGEKDGLDYGQKSVQVIKSQLERIAQNMEALPAKILQDYRDWLVQTSIRIARQIVNREIRTCPEIVADTVSALIEEAEEQRVLTVYLNPNDLEIVEKRADLTLPAKGKHIALRADRDLERGGCRIESEVQLLDASIPILFENLEKKLLSAATSQNATGETGGEQLGVQ